MKKTLLACLAMSWGSCAYAVPNVWSVSSAQGFIEYGIANNTNDSVIIACNVGAGDDYDNGVHVYHGDDARTGTISFLINDESYYIPDSTKTRNGANAWASFTDAMRSATKFEVYINDKPAGKFTPNKNNHKKTFNDFECEPLW